MLHVCAALVIQQDPKYQQFSEVGRLLDGDVDSLHGIVKSFF